MGKARVNYEDRKCAYSGCGVVFKPSRVWQHYHTKDCQRLSYIDRTRNKERAEILDLKRGLASIQGRVEILEENWKIMLAQRRASAVE